MDRIPSLYLPDPENPRYAVPDVTPGCEWVLLGEGRALRMLDGVACWIDPQGRWWVRRWCDQGEVWPPSFIASELGLDPVTGATAGWEPDVDSPYYNQLQEAQRQLRDPVPGYTYELLGKRIGRNSHRLDGHQLLRHADAELLDPPRGFHELGRWLSTRPYRGVVFYGNNGERAAARRDQWRAS